MSERKSWMDFNTFCGMYGINIYNGDCLDVMDLFIDKGDKFDMILCDLPYGTTACKWDTIIPFDELWKRYNQLITPKGAIILFGTEPFSSHLRLSNLKNWKYDWTWDKITARGHLVAKVRPMQQTEIISVFGSNGGSINYFPQMIDRPKDKIMTSWECGRTEIVGGGKQHKREFTTLRQREAELARAGRGPAPRSRPAGLDNLHRAESPTGVRVSQFHRRQPVSAA